VNSLKEEIRPKEKIRENNIRTFTASPDHAVVNGTRLFGDMNEKFYKSHVKTASAVGINPFYGGWNELYNKLKDHPRKQLGIVAYDLDETQWDSSLTPFWFNFVVRFRFMCLKKELRTSENLQRVKQYYKNIVNSIVIMQDGCIYMKTIGNPSGSVNTIVDNTLILFMCLCYAWYLLAPTELLSYESLSKRVVFALQGDDNTWTVDKETNVFYNARSVSEKFCEIGVKTTSDHMDGAALEEVTFLSSTFDKTLRGVKIYCPDSEKMIESLKWTKYPGNPSMTLIRVGAMLRVCWPDKFLRTLFREIAYAVIMRYDAIMFHDSEWKTAKAQILTDEEYAFFFIGYGGKDDTIVSHIKINNQEIYQEIMDELVSVPEKESTKIEIGVEQKGGAGKALKRLVDNVPKPLKGAGKAARKARRAARKEKRKARREGRKERRQSRRGNAAVRDMDGGSTLRPIAIATTLEDSKFVVRQGNATDIVIEGHEVLTAVNVPNDVSEGKILYKIALNPFVGSRLSNYANLYNGYKFTWWRVTYVPAISQLSANAKGIFQLAYQPDPDANDPAETVAGDQETFAWQGAREFAVFSASTFHGYKQRTPFYYIDPSVSDRRFTVQGYIYLKAGSNITGDASSYGKLYIEYVCRLNTPHTDGYQGMVSAKITSGGTTSLTNPLGSAPTVDAQGFGISVNAGNPSTVSVKYPGTFLLFSTYVGTGITALNNPTFSAGGGSWAIDAAIANAAGTLALIAGKATFNNDSATMTMGAVTGTTSTNTFVYMSRVVSGSVTQPVPRKTLVDADMVRVLVDKYLQSLSLDFPIKEEGFVKLPSLNKKKKKEKRLEELNDSD
jgi:hypothetical protein